MDKYKWIRQPEGKWRWGGMGLAGVSFSHEDEQGMDFTTILLCRSQGKT